MSYIRAFIDWINDLVGSPVASIGIIGVTVLDLLWGYISGWNSNWINGNGAGTGLLSLMLLFFLQHSQNRGNAALQLKVDQLVLAIPDAPNTVVGAEALPEVEIRRMQKTALSQVEQVVEEVVEKVNGHSEKT